MHCTLCTRPAGLTPTPRTKTEVLAWYPADQVCSCAARNFFSYAFKGYLGVAIGFKQGQVGSVLLALRKRFLPIRFSGVFSVWREEIDPLRYFKARAQGEGVAFCIGPSPGCSFARQCKACQLFTVKEGSVSDIAKCRRNVHFYALQNMNASLRICRNLVGSQMC